MNDSAKRQSLVEQIAVLIEEVDSLRSRLQTYKRSLANAAKRLADGEEAVEAIKGASSPDGRKRVTEGIQEFEDARRQVRLALFRAAMEEGASMSEIGRVLGISRQLASRVAQEAKEADS